MEMKKALGCLILIICLAGSSLSLSWQEAVEVAGQNSNELRSARKELESSEWIYKTAVSTFMPQLSANASMTETSSSTTSAKSYSYGFSATQYLFKGMAGVYGIQSAYADVEYKKANLKATRASVYYDLRSAFIDLLYTQENIKLLENILRQRKQNSSLIQLRYESGKEDKGNLMTTKAEQAQAEYDLSSAKRDLKLARLKLSQLLSKNIRSADEQIEFTAPAGTEFDKLLSETPSYVMAEKQLENNELSFKSTISGFLPSVRLSGNLTKRGSNWPPDTDSNSWSLNLSYPFFPGGSNLTDRAAKSAQLDGAREDFIKQAKDLRYALEQAFESFNDAIESLKVSKVSLAATRERAKIIEAKYLNGLAIYDEWYRIENNHINAQKGLLNSKRQALLAEAVWHQTYGGYVK
jgi:outer membrane protein